jgi:hypothetical protein
VAAGLALRQLVSSANAASDRFAQYNAPIAQAQAQAEIQNLQGDMRRAQEAAPQLTEFIKAQSENTQVMQDIKTEILTVLVPIATGFLQLVTDIARFVKPKVDITANGQLEEFLRGAFGALGTDQNDRRLQ